MGHVRTVSRSFRLVCSLAEAPLVESLLASQGFDEVEEVRTATEDLMFSLPQELRSDLKKTGSDIVRPRRERRRQLDVTAG